MQEEALSTGPLDEHYPVRDYIAAMAMELARMARWDGDETLGVLLEAAAVQAGEDRKVI